MFLTECTKFRLFFFIYLIVVNRSIAIILNIIIFWCNRSIVEISFDVTIRRNDGLITCCSVLTVFNIIVFFSIIINYVMLHIFPEKVLLLFLVLIKEAVICLIFLKSINILGICYNK